MGILRIDKYVINTPIIDILQRLKMSLVNGKLRDIKPGIDNIVVTCPVHSGGVENTAACNIYIGDSHSIEYGYYRCFVCESQGSFVDFVSHCFDRSKEFAKDWLISTFGTLAEDYISIGEPINIYKRKQNINKYLSVSELDKYQNWHPYLAQRKLSRQICEQFKIKYDPYWRQIIFPVFDKNNNLITLLKRSIDTKTFYIEKSISKPLYGFDQILKNNIKTAVVTEGLIDTLLGNQYGMPTFGTLGKPSDEQISQINNSDLTTLYLMFDNDEAGRSFKKMFHEKISNRIFLVDVDITTPYKDIGDLTADLFWKYINEAKEKENNLIYIKK